jgi:hypothetical protein
MRVRRDVSSIPYRSAGETWDVIVDLITGTGSRDKEQLAAARGVMASIITDEHPANRDIRIEGAGPQLRVYCRYGMKAIEEGGEVDSLTWNPTAGDWTIHVPCDAENLVWVRASLAETSARIRVFDIAEPEQADEGVNDVAAKSGGLVIDWNVRG